MSTDPQLRLKLGICGLSPPRSEFQVGQHQEDRVNPGPRDKSIHVTRDDVAAALKAVGLVPGDIALFHSSLSSMGTVVGGPDTVIDGFLDAVGPEGTVAVPTLCRWPPEERHLTFDRWNPEISPSYVGRITETFRLRPDAVRSDHATHSIGAIGAREVVSGGFRRLAGGDPTERGTMNPWDG